MSAVRDFQLAEMADTVASALLQTGDPAAPVLTQGRRLEARETVLRFRDQTLALLPFALEYTPNMPEPALRAWAADLVKALKNE